MKSALVLTAAMVPHKIYVWHKSVCAALSGDVDVLEEYEDETISGPSLSIQNPAVLRIRKSMVKTKKRACFSRGNVYSYYGHRCQYCGVRFKARDLNYDHVMPRHRGGPTDWNNVVPSCYSCNERKGGRTPEEAGMKLLRLPSQPSSLPIVGVIALPRHVPEIWLPYLEGHRTMQAVG
jgi:5-methylcytosine-specific restriction endonuclease McrA